jgi:hypothetical protein
MQSKEQILKSLKEEFSQWDGLLAGMSEEQATSPRPPSNWSIKDEVIHLWWWQQRTLARAEAALQDKDPQYPTWPERLGPDPNEDVDQTNAWSQETYGGKPWPSAYADWRSQFLRILELSEQIPEKDLLEPGRYAWMESYPLIASLEGTYEHHAEHLEGLLASPGK